MTGDQQPLDDAGRRVLAGLADVLIPAGAGLPSATAVGVHQQILDRVLAVRPDLRSGLLDVIAAGAGRPPREVVDHLRNHRRDLFGVLTLVIAGGYLMSQEVTERLTPQGQGRPVDPYPGQGKLVDPGDIVKTADSGRLDQVAARSPFWRRPPDAPADAQ